jgi:50S ribosomal subunit-associated GTPase HflX
MKFALRAAPVVVLAWCLSLSLLMAADKADKQKQKAEGKKSPAPAALKLPKGIELSSEQEAQLDALQKEIGPKLEAARAQLASILTPERKQAQMEAMKAAKAAGKSAKEAKESVQAALNLSDAEKAQLAEAQRAVGELQKDIRSRIMALLTAEQKERLGGPKKEKKPE